MKIHESLSSWCLTDSVCHLDQIIKNCILLAGGWWTETEFVRWVQLQVSTDTSSYGHTVFFNGHTVFYHNSILLIGVLFFSLLQGGDI